MLEQLRLENQVFGCPVWNVRVNAASMPEGRRIQYQQISECEPFCQKDTARVTVLADLDGFFLHGGKDNNLKDNLKRIMALRDIAAKSDEVVFWTSRVDLDESGFFGKLAGTVFDRKSISCFPFLSNSSKERLETFVRHANSSCRVSFRTGLRKTVGGSDGNLVTEIAGAIRAGEKVAILGSSLFDRRFVQQLTGELNRCDLSSDSVFYFDSGRLFL